MSTSVARALACLGLPVTYVGDKGQPGKGTSDLLVAQHAKKQKRVLFTANFDMVMAACDTGAPLHMVRRSEAEPDTYGYGPYHLSQLE